MVKVKEDMTGWKMWEHGVPDSRLIIVHQTDDYIASNGRHQARYLCKCNCGSDKNIVAFPRDIKDGSIKSCGCFQKENMSKIMKKYNKWLDEVFTDEYGNYRIGFTSNTNKEFYVDVDNFDIVKDYCWCEVVDKDSGYRELRTHDATINKDIRMHQLLGFSKHDHIDRNPLNNRKSNLRQATIQDNNRNRSLFQNNTSGIMGVDWHKSTNRWRSRINVNNNRIELGFFVDKEDAIRARLRAEKEHYGQFAPQRHLFNEYGIEDDFMEA